MMKSDTDDNITEQEFFKILESGNIKMKRLTVGVHSKLDGIELKWTNLPKDVLMGPLVRRKEVILPDGDTKLKHGDVIIIFGTQHDLELTKDLLLAEGIITRIKKIISGLISRKKKTTPSPDGNDTD